jgi:tripartite-type tricarboxylate transporter receptor subunit TctC
VIARLNAAFVDTLKDKSVVDRIHALGAQPMPMTPDAFSTYIRSEIAKWLKVAEKASTKGR